MNTSTLTNPYGEVEKLLESAVQDDKDAGIFRCRRDIFTDPALFELEMKYKKKQRAGQQKFGK